jgi:hypothetical protein
LAIYLSFAYNLCYLLCGLAVFAKEVVLLLVLASFLEKLLRRRWRVVFGPAVILPALWGIWAALKRLLAGEMNFVVLALLLNALLIPFLPFSTFRETGGLLRISCGLVLAIILFAGRYRLWRVLNYGYLLLILNAFLLKS